MRALAQELNVDPMAVYHYFTSKDDLLGAMARELLQSLGTYLAETSSLPPDERLVAMGMEYLAFARDRPDHFALLYDNLPAGESTWEEFMRRAWPMQLVREAVVQGVRTGAFIEKPERSIDEMSYAIWSLVHGAAVLRRSRLRNVTGDYEHIHRRVLESYVASLSI